MSTASREQTPQYTVLAPTGPHKQTVDLQQTPPLTTVDGKRIGQLWDYLFNGDVVFQMLEERFRAQFPTTSFVGYETFGNTHGDDEETLLEELPELLRSHRCDAVVSGIGC